jgi:hypothetical protein
VVLLGLGVGIQWRFISVFLIANSVFWYIMCARAFFDRSTDHCVYVVDIRTKEYHLAQGKSIVCL